MPPLVRRDIWFDSSDGQNKVAGYIYTNPYVTPYCVVQISHGMCEYFARYEEFARFLTQYGIAVCGNDHLGHGKTAKTPEDLGYFGTRGGRNFAVRDLRQMNKIIREVFPQRPIILLGHSMGSFLARKYVVKWPQTVDGFIISGTGGPNSATNMAIRMVEVLVRMRGERHRSKLAFRLAFGKYLQKIDHPNTVYDWLTRDEEIVAKYAADPLCTFRFTLNGYRELFSALRDVSSPQWAAAVRKNMPVLMIQGDGDPVGDYGEGTAIVRDWLQQAGVKNLEYRLYHGARHEVLNESNRKEVYGDVLEFIQFWWGRADRPREEKSRPAGKWKFTGKHR